MSNDNNLNSKFIDPLIMNESEGKDSGLINPLILEAKTKSFEEKVYIILYEIDDSSIEQMYTHIFSICEGRTYAYNDIKEKLESGVPIDIHRSIVITETKQVDIQTGDKKYFLVPFNESISVYAFCTNVKSFYTNDAFDIEDYNTGDVPEDNLTDVIPHLTPEQETYKKMLNASIKSDKLLPELMRMVQNNSDDNNLV